MSDTENLKEKYPELITLDALRQILHVSKRRCAWMLANGIIPCSITGKKTRQYRIRIDDVIEYLERITGYAKIAVSKLINSGKLKSVSVCGEPIISKEWIIDFMCDYGWRTVNKSEKHRKIMDLYNSKTCK